MLDLIFVVPLVFIPYCLGLYFCLIDFFSKHEFSAPKTTKFFGSVFIVYCLFFFGYYLWQPKITEYNYIEMGKISSVKFDFRRELFFCEVSNVPISLCVSNKENLPIVGDSLYKKEITVKKGVFEHYDWCYTTEK
jgi:hypothetical protein